MRTGPLYFCARCNFYFYHPDTVPRPCPSCLSKHSLPVGYQRATKFGRFALYFCPACSTLYRLPKTGPLPACGCSQTPTVKLDFVRYLKCIEELSKTASIT